MNDMFRKRDQFLACPSFVLSANSDFVLRRTGS